MRCEPEDAVPSSVAYSTLAGESPPKLGSLVITTSTNPPRVTTVPGGTTETVSVAPAIPAVTQRVISCAGDLTLSIRRKASRDEHGNLRLEEAR